MAGVQDLPKPNPKVRAAAGAGGIMMGALLLSRFLGLFRETVMASQFGIKLDTDSLIVAFSIPDFLFMLIAGGGLSSAFIPVFSEYLHTDREKDAWNVFNVVVTLTSLIIIVLIALAWIFAPQLVTFMSQHNPIPGQSARSIDMNKAVLMSRILLPAQFSFLVGSIVLATLYASKRFVVPALAPSIYNFGIIIGAILGPILSIGIVGMSWGALIGAMLGNLVIPVFIMIRLGGHYRPSLNIKAPGVKKFFILLLPVILGFSLPSVCNLITIKFSSFYGEGIVTAMRSSNNLMQAPLGIFGQALAMAAFPVLAQFFAQQQMEKFRLEVSRSLRTIIYLSTPASVIMLVLAQQIVDILYKHGAAAKDLDNLHNIATSLQVFAFGVVAWCMQPMLMRGFFSVHKTFKPILMSTGVTLLFILLCWANGYTSLGFLGLPLATNIAALVLAIVLFVALEKEVGSLDKVGIFSTLGKSLLGSVGLGAFCFAAYYFWHPTGIALILSFIVVCCIAGWIYYYITRALNMPETKYVERAMERINRNKRPIAEIEATLD